MHMAVFMPETIVSTPCSYSGRARVSSHAGTGSSLQTLKAVFEKIMALNARKLARALKEGDGEYKRGKQRTLT